MGPPIERWCQVLVEMGPPIERRCQVSNPLIKRNPHKIYKLSSCWSSYANYTQITHEKEVHDMTKLQEGVLS